MPVVFDGATATIRKSWIGSRVTVQDRISGRKVVAPAALVARCAELLRIQETLELTAARRDFVVSYVLDRFAAAVLFPDSAMASMFTSGDGFRLLSSAMLAADPEAAEMFRLRSARPDYDELRGDAEEAARAEAMRSRK